MATKKTKKATTKNTKSSTVKENYFNFGESYTSLILGIVVVIIASILLISFVRNSGQVSPIQEDKPDISATSIGPKDEESSEANHSRHTVEAGEGLWQIAEERYGSGYNWVDIARANNISNPDQIVAGVVIVLPDVEPKQRTIVDAVQSARENLAQRADRIEASSYTVQEGDTLWSIAERKYGDGFVYAQIVTENRISNPQLIEVGQTIRLPNLPNSPNSN